MNSHSHLSSTDFDGAACRDLD